MRFDYDAYIAAFNTGDDEALIERFFAEDCVMESASGTFSGHDGMRKFLGWAHDGVRECPRIVSYVQGENTLFAEIDMDFHATKERADFPFKHLFPGDSVTVKFLARYALNDEGKITLLNTMTWPPEKGVSRLPKLGAHPSQIAAYHAYAAAFSAGDGGRFGAFYTDNVALELPSAPRIEGRNGIVKFYADMSESVVETLTIHSLEASDDQITVDCTSRFTAIKDAPDFVVKPLAKGEFTETHVVVAYSLKDGLVDFIKVRRA